VSGDGVASPARRFPVRFGAFNTVLMTVLGIGPGRAYAELGDDDLVVRMGWAFSARIPRAAVVEAAPLGRYVWWAYGVHAAGRKRWIVNGSGHRVVRLRFEPLQRGRVSGIPVRLRELWISLQDPDGFLAALGDRFDQV
jgi:hypothetical protein